MVRSTSCGRRSRWAVTVKEPLAFVGWALLFAQGPLAYTCGSARCGDAR